MRRVSRRIPRSIPIHAVSIVALLALMAFLMARIFLPYASILLWSAVFYLMLRPLYQKIVSLLDSQKRFFKAKCSALAALFSVGTVVIVAFFFGFLMVSLAGQITSFVNDIVHFVNSNLDFFNETEAGIRISQLVLEWSMGTIDLSSMDIKAQIISLLRQYSNTILSLSRSFVSNLADLAVSLCFMCFSLFFFYADGPYLLNLLISAIPIDRRQARALIGKFRDVIGNLVQGLILVALYQAAAAFIIFSAFRITGALLFAILVFFCSFIPMFGCAIVWLPLGIMLAATRGVLMATFFIILCAVLISFMDNFLRPFLLKDRIKVHPLLIFFSMLGGINFFGINGIIFGPMTVILFFTIVDMATGNYFGSEAKEASDDGEGGKNGNGKQH